MYDNRASLISGNFKMKNKYIDLPHKFSPLRIFIFHISPDNLLQLLNEINLKLSSEFEYGENVHNMLFVFHMNLLPLITRF